MAALTNVDFLECYVCLSTVKSPRVLPCGHSLCEACLEPLIQAENGQLKVTCPECRSDYDRPADGFPKNFKLVEMLDKLKLTGDRSSKKCSACDDNIDVSKAFRCLACEKDFALWEIILCGSCAIRNHKGHTILDLSSLPKQCYEQIGDGAASLTIPDFKEFRNDAKTPTKGASNEVSGVNWCVMSWYEEGQFDGADVAHWFFDATFPDTRRVWVDAQFSFVKSDGSTVYFGGMTKELFGSTTMPRRAGFASTKSQVESQYLREDGTLQVTVDFSVFKDVFSEQHEVWDTRLVVDDHTIYVSRPMLSAESYVLSEALQDDSVSVIPVSNATAAELILFIAHLHYFIDDFNYAQDSSLNEMEAKALYRAADVFCVGWLTDRLDEHVMKKVVNNDIQEALFIASACKRDVICNRIVARMTTEDIAGICFMLKCKIARRNGSEPKLDNETLIDLLVKCKSPDDETSST